jgi:AcrR family transcriptional regulator
MNSPKSVATEHENRRDADAGTEPQGSKQPSPPRSVGRPAIPVERIIAAALQIVDEDGADALSMRSVAQRLNSGTATLYRHFASRSQLVAGVVDFALGPVTIDVDELGTMTWQQACKASAHSMFSALSAHRNAAPLLVGRIPTGPNALAHREACVRLLLKAGFAPSLAARTYATIARYILGFAMQLAADSDLEDARATHEFHALAPAQYPATTTVADALPVPLEEEFAFGLDLIIEGLSRLHP